MLVKLTKALAFAAAIVLPGCATRPLPAPVVSVQYQDRLVEVPRPCAVERPTRPASLAKPLPSSAAQLIDALAAKLLEWAGPGGYGDRADAAIATCTRE